MFNGRKRSLTQVVVDRIECVCHLQAYRYEGRLVQLAERLNSEAAARLLESAASHEEDIDVRLDERTRQLAAANRQLEASLHLHSEVRPGFIIYLLLGCMHVVRPLWQCLRMGCAAMPGL